MTTAAKTMTNTFIACHCLSDACINLSNILLQLIGCLRINSWM